MKSLTDTRKWKKLMKDITEAKKDPKFMKAVREFIRYHTGKTS
jgi:hypothetical protein|tara:strand:- start:2772 stop:2900 length:129 start_codon:yes stop_codon:yes gene_type:complete